MHVFISRALSKIYREAPKKYTQLRTACNEVIDELKKNGAESFPKRELESATPPLTPSQSEFSSREDGEHVEESSAMDDESEEAMDKRMLSPDNMSHGATGEALQVSGTDRYFVPLRLACESKLPRIMEVALHCIQKLLLYGYVDGKIVQVGKVKKNMMDVVMETICSCKDQEDEAVQLQIVKAVLTAVTSSVSTVHETTLLLAVKTCFYIYLVSRTAVIQTTANATLTQMLNVVFQRLEITDRSNSSMSEVQRDAFLVFRSLCKLSMKPLPEPLPSEDSIELRSKLLSLQLLYSIIQNAGAKFRSGEKFIWAIRQYLCVSLLKNGVSPISSILQISLDIFVTVIRFFKDFLKSEIGVFFSNILLRILESSNSSGQQKMLTVQALRVLVREPQLVVDLFLNYDCDLEAKNIVAHMCDGLSRLTVSHQPLTDSIEQDTALKNLALETLVVITDSMVQWASEGKDSSAKLAIEADTSLAEGSTGLSAAPSDAGPSDEGTKESGAIVPADEAKMNFEAMFHRKAELQEGVIKFNMKPKKGIQYLRKVCGLEESAEATAKFLLKTAGLDKRAVGDFLGEGDDFNKQVLYKYVDLIDFKDMTFDAALRKFLSHFWLPGEAQKIDRMMEKFAERFCSLNPGVFANPDTAYVLAYSLIMLNTDAHSSQIKKKMTQQEFVNMNRGINDSGDLPTPFLEQLYQAITTHEIRIKEDMFPSASKEPPSTRPNKSKLFNMESAAMVKESQEAFKAKASKKSTYFSSRNVEDVRPLFESTWCALLAACASVMEEPESPSSEAVYALSLRGFANCVHVAAEFGAQTERDAFVTMLAKYTYLESTKMMGKRNIESFKTLVQLALSDGNGLGNSWAQVLKCLSEFQRLHMIGTGAKTDAQLFFPSSSGESNGSNGPPNPPASTAGKHSSLRTTTRMSTAIIQPARPRSSTTGLIKDHELAAVDEMNSQTMVDKVDVVAIDRIFSNSAYLNPDAIVQFVTYLCAVSREELSSPTDPQVYSLQKIVEIAYYNMSRVRLVWARIWEVLGEFFTEVGQHHNLSIAMYAVDSLRQLSAKFLEKGELLNYQFQREFLKPFVDLMGLTSSREIKELILGCLGHMAQSRAMSIRSGWRPVFDVFAIAANDASSEITLAGFDLLRRTVNDHFEQLGEHHGECVGCLCAFLQQQQHEAVALQASKCLVEYAARLREQSPTSEEAGTSAASAEHSSALDSVGAPSSASPAMPSGSLREKVWWPLLHGLATAVGDRRFSVRASALTGLFDTVNLELAPGGALCGDLGDRVFRQLLLPMFAAVPSDPEAPVSPANLDWLQTTGRPALTALERTFCAAYSQFAPLLDDVMALLVRCLQQRQHPPLAHATAEALLHLVKETGANFSHETWASVCAELKSCFASGDAAPIDEAVPPPVGSNSTPLLTEVEAKVEAEAPPGSGPHEMQVLLLSTVYQLLQSMYPSMKLSDVEGLLNCMHSMYGKSHSVLQSQLTKVADGGAVDVDDEALRIELEAMSFYLQVLFSLYAKLEPGLTPPPKGETPPLGSDAHILLIASAAEYRLISFCLHVLRDYVKVHELAVGGNKMAQKILKQLTSNVVMLLQGILQFHEPQFEQHLQAFYPLFVDLMHCDSKLIRQTLRDIFSNRISTVLQQRQNA